MEVPTKPLRVLVVDNYPEANGSCIPFPSFTESVNCPYPGWCLEILSILVKSANISVEWIVQRQNSSTGGLLDWGTLLPNHTFSGVLGQLQKNMFDTACLFYQQSSIRSQYFDYSMPVSQITPVFIVKEVSVDFGSLLFNCLRPFSTTVWEFFLISVIIQMAIITFYGWTEIKLRLRAREDLDDCAWWVLDELLNGSIHTFNLWSATISRMVFSIFGVGLLPAMYTALLLTALLTPVSRSPIQSSLDVIELVRSGKYKLIVKPSSWFYQEILNSTDPLFAGIRDATRFNPMIFPSSTQQAIDLVNRGNYIYQTQEDDAVITVVQDACYTVLFSQGLPTKTTHFIWPFNNTFKPILDRQILMSYDMTDAMYDRYFQDRSYYGISPHCDPQPFSTPGPNKPLNFWAVCGVFAISLCLLMIAAGVLLIENITAFIKNGRMKTGTQEKKKPVKE